MTEEQKTEQQLDSDYWSARYKEGKTGWDRGDASPSLIQWIETGKMTPGRILVPGCGRGHEVVELCRRGFDVTAIDFSQHPIDHLREILQTQQLTATLVQSDVLHFQPDQTFDAVYEQTCLCAMYPNHWSDYEAQLQRWLKPQGQLFACFMQSPEHLNPPFHCDVDAMRQLFQPQRWAWPASLLDIHHPSGLIEKAGILTRI